MKPNRINLFRQIVKKPTVSVSPKVKTDFLKGFKLNSQLGFAVITIVVFLAAQVMLFVKYKSQINSLNEAQLKSEAELKEITEESARRVTQVEESRRLASEEKQKAKTESNSRILINPGLDATWTSVMWKLSTFTQREVVIDKMDFSLGATRTDPPLPLRKVSIDGQAESLVALKEWLQQLTLNLPLANFVMEREGKSNRKNFPLDFRVTGEIL